MDRPISTEIPIPIQKKSDGNGDDDYEMEIYLRRLAMYNTLQINKIPIKDEELSSEIEEFYSYGIGPTEVIHRKLECGLSDDDIEGSTDIDGCQSIDVSLNSASTSEEEQEEEEEGVEEDQEINQFDIEI